MDICPWILYLIKNGRGREKTITQEKHPGHAAQGHKLAGLQIGKRRNIAQQRTVYRTVYSAVYKQSLVQSTEQISVQSCLQCSQMELMYIALVYLLSLPLVFVYFFFVEHFSG